MMMMMDNDNDNDLGAFLAVAHNFIALLIIVAAIFLLLVSMPLLCSSSTQVIRRDFTIAIDNDSIDPNFEPCDAFLDQIFSPHFVLPPGWRSCHCSEGGLEKSSTKAFMNPT
jgi:hypothetical protein